MSVLVTGASGFLGSWLVRRLVERGERPRVLVRPTSALEDLEGLDLERHVGDVTDRDSVVAAARGVDVIYHLAGVVGYTARDRAVMERVNVGGTRAVIAALREAAPRAKLVHLSSVVAVGASRTPRVLNEDSPYEIGPLDLGYFETKREAEDLVRAATDVDSVILNPSTIYGAGDARKGSRRTQLAVARGRMPFYTGGGVSVVSVHDVVDAILVAPTRGRRGERYILAGENVTIRDLFARIAAAAGVPPPRVRLPDPVVRGLGLVGGALEKLGSKGPLNSDTAWTARLYHWFDHDKARRELGFAARPADEAIRESVGWMKQEGLLE